MKFLDSLRDMQERHQSTLAVGLAPAVNLMPAEYAKYDDPFFPFGKAVIDATRDLVCAYVFHLGAYLALGGAGAVALERTIAYVPRGIVRILHGPLVSPDFAASISDDAFDCHALTLAPAVLSADVLKAYLGKPEMGVFVPRDLALPAEAAPYAGQIGTYALISGEQGQFQIDDVAMRWFWGTTLYTSRRLDFSERLRATAESLRR